MKLDPLQIFLAILRYIPAIVAIVVAIVFIFSFKIVVITNEMERTNIEMAENFFSSKLAFDRAVFDPDQLDKLIQDANALFGRTDKNPNIENESIARHCSIAYYAEIEDLTDSSKKWEFGYAPAEGKDNEALLQSRSEYPTSLYIKSDKGRGYEDVHPARLTLTLRETWLSRIGCMVEEAHDFREIRTVQVPCIYEKLVEESIPGVGITLGKKACLLSVKRSAENGKHICLDKPGGTIRIFDTQQAECRYFPGEINLVDMVDAYDKEKQKTLTAYPLKEEVQKDLNYNDYRELCDQLNKKQKQAAGTGDVVKSVVLCLR